MRPIKSLFVLALLPLQASLAQTAVKWGPAPAVFPKGAKMAVLQGDPHHWAVANGHTVVQVHAIGPFQLSYVNPADDPSKKTVAKK